MAPNYIVRFGEIGIKAPRARRRFERTLVRNIKRALTKEGLEHEFAFDRGRIFLYSNEPCDHILRYVFGIVSFSRFKESPSDMGAITELALNTAREVIKEGESFALRVRRKGTHPYTSMDVAREVGEAIRNALSELKVRVDLTHPDRELYIEIRNNKAYVYTQKSKGPGGLPLGTQGRALCLISSRNDVTAALGVMKRGITPLFMVQRGTDRTLLNDIERWMPGYNIDDYIIETDTLTYHDRSGYAMDFYIHAARVASEYGALAIVSGESMEQLTNKVEFRPGKWPLDIPLFLPNVAHPHNLDHFFMQSTQRPPGSQ